MKDQIAAETTAAETETPVAGSVDAATAVAQLAELRNQQRQLAEQAKALRAAMPKVDPLTKVLQAQAERPADPLLLGKVKGRIAAGQDRATAIDEVLAAAKAWLEANVPE